MLLRVMENTKLLAVLGISATIIISIFAVMWQEYGMVCNNAVTKHLQKYSNLFWDEVTYETYAIENIGFPFGVHSWNVQECVNFTFEERTASMGLENED